jgi:uncharacterized protein YoxC
MNNNSHNDGGVFNPAFIADMVAWKNFTQSKGEAQMDINENMLKAYDTLLDGYEKSFDKVKKERDDAIQKSQEINQYSYGLIEEINASHKHIDELEAEVEALREVKKSEKKVTWLANAVDTLGNLLDDYKEVSEFTRKINAQYKELGLRFSKPVVNEIMQHSHGIIVGVDEDQFNSWIKDDWTIESTTDNTFVGSPDTVSAMVEDMDFVSHLQVGFDSVYIVVNDTEVM